MPLTLMEAMLLPLINTSLAAGSKSDGRFLLPLRETNKCEFIYYSMYMSLLNEY